MEKRRGRREDGEREKKRRRQKTSVWLGPGLQRRWVQAHRGLQRHRICLSEKFSISVLWRVRVSEGWRRGMVGMREKKPRFSAGRHAETRLELGVTDGIFRPASASRR